ncbi:hypothetical protein [Actinoplanes sp. NPDC026619]|uniref:hypothetical protein n=1 Tax=Actinoplanes sp. NPDC026619 TaxID=3155798 RepID=UPI0033FF5AF6
MVPGADAPADLRRFGIRLERVARGVRVRWHGWGAGGASGGPCQVSEWAAQGSYSLTADVALGSGQSYSLSKVATLSLASGSTLRATVRAATWGTLGSGRRSPATGDRRGRRQLTGRVRSAFMVSPTRPSFICGKWPGRVWRA